MKKLLVLASALILAACGTYKPCDPDKLNCDNGTRATGGAVTRSINAPAKGPSESNNPGKPSTGGQVGPSKPGKPGHGHGDKNHSHNGPPGKHNGGKGK